MKRKFSIIIPVYNRPDEVDELLESLIRQTYRNFEVIIVEDGSRDTSEAVVEKYLHELDITYCVKKNEGQGFARNYGYEHAKGDYYIVFDSDCVIPPSYLQTVNEHLNTNKLDAYGGPDRAHESFSTIQKAINYSMTSFFTTGGTRSGHENLAPYHPRSFNMGISPEVYHKTGGYIIPYKGEDIEFSIRILQHGFKTGFIKEAYVYHKRRTSWWHFFKQIRFFGMARINIGRFFPDQLKWIHFVPLLFIIGIILMLLFLPFVLSISIFLFIVYLFFALLLFLDSLLHKNSFRVAFLGVVAGFIQLTAYGLGFIQEGITRIIKG